MLTPKSVQILHVSLSFSAYVCMCVCGFGDFVVYFRSNVSNLNAKKRTQFIQQQQQQKNHFSKLSTENFNSNHMQTQCNHSVFSEQQHSKEKKIIFHVLFCYTQTLFCCCCCFLRIFFRFFFSFVAVVVVDVVVALVFLYFISRI